MPEPVRQDNKLPFWTFETAALHLGVSRKTIVRYVREGLPAHFAGKFVRPSEVVAENQRRTQRQNDARKRTQ